MSFKLPRLSEVLQAGALTESLILSGVWDPASVVEIWEPRVIEKICPCKREEQRKKEVARKSGRN